MGETKVQGCEEKERVLLLWERALTLFYENDTELFVAGAQDEQLQEKSQCIWTGYTQSSFKCLDW